MRYKCTFCEYSTNNRSQIHIHHIIPRENNGNNKKFNCVILCPNHHSLIYSNDSKQGIHSIKHNNSIEIIAKRNNGTILEIIRNNQTEYINI